MSQTHCSGAVHPSVVVVWPVEHAKQAVAPKLDWYVPIAHSVHT